MKKRILCLAMTLLMAFGAGMTASAEDFYGSDDWSVTFTGDEMVSNFTTAELTEEILQIQPGDSITVKVNLKNEDKAKTDWYMTNEVLKTLEESVTVAEGGAYTYILTYHNVAGEETVLYNSQVVGGEEDTSLEGLGLHQATNALEDYFYLDRLESGDTASVQLYVQLEGETQGNDYQKTLAAVQMNFAVEKVTDNVTIEKIFETVQTGDTAPVMMFSLLTLASGLILLIIAVKTMKKQRYE